MPEIDIIHVEKWGDGYEATDPVGDVLHASDPDFGVTDMEALSKEYGVTRWSEYDADANCLDLTRVDGSPMPIVLVGWAEAPITRDDVETHSEMSRPSHPAVNIKVYDTTLPKGDAFAEVVAEHELDSRLQSLPLEDLRSLVERYIEKDDENFTFNWVGQRGFEDASDEAKYNSFPDYSIDVYAEGRSGGWLVVHGLPPVEAWGVKLLTAWKQFEEFCKGLVADVPRAMVWDVLANHQDDLAERVIRIEITLVVADADFEQDAQSDRALTADPATWDWHDMLDLTRETEIRARKLG